MVNDDNELVRAIAFAREEGYEVETREVAPGTVGYQLKDPQGHYVQFGGSEESVWRYAFEDGLLPTTANGEGR